MTLGPWAAFSIYLITFLSETRLWMVDIGQIEPTYSETVTFMLALTKAGIVSSQ